LGDSPVSSQLDAIVINSEPHTETVIKLTVSTLYPELCYPLTLSDAENSNDWWREAPHSIDGRPPFKATNLTYSTPDAAGTNYVIYVQKTKPAQMFKMGPAARGNIEARTHVNGTNTLPYRILKPDVYNPKRAYPLVIAFHGAGGVGTDNTSRSIDAWGHLSTAKVRQEHPIFMITPQTKGKWADTPWADGSYSVDATPVTVSMTMAYEIIDSLQEEFNIDSSRIYVIGQSMGGFGAWDCVMRQPERFAALLPMAGGGDPTQAANLLNVAIWNFYGSADTVVPTSASREMDAALKKAGHPNYIYSEYPGVGHAVTKWAWDETNIIPWIFQQKKP
jgi:predicted peptidase